MSKMMSKKRICLLAVGLTLLLAAGFFLALPRTSLRRAVLRDGVEPRRAAFLRRRSPRGQWRSSDGQRAREFRTGKSTTYEDKRFDRNFGVDPLALARA